MKDEAQIRLIIAHFEHLLVKYQQEGDFAQGVVTNHGPDKFIYYPEEANRAEDVVTYFRELRIGTRRDIQMMRWVLNENTDGTPISPEDDALDSSFQKGSLDPSRSYTLPGWQFNGRFYAKDCPTCGGSGDNATGGTCDECNGSGEMPADDCPPSVAGLIIARNERRGHNDDPSDLDPHSYDDDEEDEDDDRAHPREPEDDEQLCPVCGGYGGESYSSDFGTCEECGGSGVVDGNWGEGEEDEDEEAEEEE